MKRHKLSLLSLTFIFFLFQNCGEGFETDIGSIESGSLSAPPAPAPSPAPVPTPPPAPSPVPTGQFVDVFMATGHMARTVMSCDDGLSWINDRSENDAARCWAPVSDPNYVECDHTPYSGRGIDSGDGWFFTNYGWGYNGSVRKSRDGINWEIIKTGGWGDGVAYANNVLFSAWGQWSTSLDLGANWSLIQNSPFQSLSHPKTRRLGDRIFMFGRTGGMVFSNDQGLTWTKPVFDSSWGPEIAEGNGILLSVGYFFGHPNESVGYIARSLDNGYTWQAQEVFRKLGQSFVGAVYFTNNKFITWSSGEAWTSFDGVTWAKQPVSLDKGVPQQFRGPVGYNPNTGTFVASPAPFGQSYTQQMMLRSTDGVNWKVLDSNQFKRGHPIERITSGKMDKAYCL